MLGPFFFNSVHQRATDHASGLLGNEEEHILWLVHEFNLAQIDRFLHFGQSKGLAHNELLFLFVKFGLLDSCQRVNLREICYLALLIWVTIFAKIFIRYDRFELISTCCISIIIILRWLNRSLHRIFSCSTCRSRALTTRCLSAEAFPLLLGFLLDLNPEIITVGCSLDHLEHSVLDFDALQGHENETRIAIVIVDFVAESPSSTFDRRLDTIAGTGSIQGNGTTKADPVTFAFSQLGVLVDLAARLLAGSVIAQLIAVCLDLHKIVSSIRLFLLFFCRCRFCSIWWFFLSFASCIVLIIALLKVFIVILGCVDHDLRFSVRWLFHLLDWGGRELLLLTLGIFLFFFVFRAEFDTFLDRWNRNFFIINITIRSWSFNYIFALVVWRSLARTLITPTTILRTVQFTTLFQIRSLRTIITSTFNNRLFIVLNRDFPPTLLVRCTALLWWLAELAQLRHFFLLLLFTRGCIHWLSFFLLFILFFDLLFNG